MRLKLTGCRGLLLSTGVSCPFPYWMVGGLGEGSPSCLDSPLLDTAEV